MVQFVENKNVKINFLDFKNMLAPVPIKKLVLVPSSEIPSSGIFGFRFRRLVKVPVPFYP